MKRQQVRQGDVFLMPSTKAIAGTKKPLEDGRVILAHGEVTGHAHAIVDLDEAARHELPPAALYEEADGTVMLLVDRPCALRHEEHGLIPIAPGAYRVVRQREYSPEEIRTVAD